MSVNLIVAIGNYVSGKGYPIGKDGKIPWHNSADLKWFRETTENHPVIMGRKTFESIGHPLPNRINIIVTKDTKGYDIEDGIYKASSVEEAIKLAKSYSSDDIFVIGGKSIYEYALKHDLIDKIYVDFLSEKVDDADTFLKDDFFGGSKWQQEGDPIEVESKHAYAVIFSRTRGARNHIDEQYFNLVNDIIKNGEQKDTRAGKTHSVFSRQLRFNLKEGLPMLTTKKVFSKGIIHELLWFLKGDTNIKYLVDNGVHIWDDDAYRYYLELARGRNIKSAESKEGFIKKVGEYNNWKMSYGPYRYGDLNNVYGYQWTKWGGHNQIQEVIDTLKTNPDDRRMIVSAWNVEDIPDMALPPCHFCCQFYTKKMTLEERKKWTIEHAGELNFQFIGVNVNDFTNEDCDNFNIPTRKLSCVWHQRSVDTICGLPFNMASYAILTHMIAQCVNMDVDELIFDGGDCHVYDNQIETYKKEQMSRNPHMYALPTLKLNPDIKNIFDFKYDDIKIEKYQSYPAIKYTLSTGLIETKKQQING